jgi:hypothetical protein
MNEVKTGMSRRKQVAPNNCAISVQRIGAYFTTFKRRTCCITIMLTVMKRGRVGGLLFERKHQAVQRKMGLVGAFVQLVSQLDKGKSGRVQRLH